MYKVLILLLLWVGIIIGVVISGDDKYNTDKYKEFNGIVLDFRCEKPAVSTTKA